MWSAPTTGHNKDAHSSPTPQKPTALNLGNKVASSSQSFSTQSWEPGLPLFWQDRDQQQLFHSACLLGISGFVMGLQVCQFKGFKAILSEGIMLPRNIGTDPFSNKALCSADSSHTDHKSQKSSLSSLKVQAQITPLFSPIKPTIHEAYRPLGCQDSQWPCLKIVQRGSVHQNQKLWLLW